MTDKSANKMWGGRFALSPAEIMEEINASIGFDKRLAAEDIAGSKAHAQMLAMARRYRSMRLTGALELKAYPKPLGAVRLNSWIGNLPEIDEYNGVE